MYYRTNPLVVIVIVAVFIIVFTLFKLRKRGQGTGTLNRLGKGQNAQNSQVDNMITLMILQQMMQCDSHNISSNVEEEEVDTEHNEYIDKIKNEILNILGE